MRFADARATATLTIAIVLVSVLIVLTRQQDAAALLAGFIPARVAGAQLPAGLWPVPVALTPLTATLVHAGLIHLGFNIVMLVFCGREVERALGSWGVVVLFMVGAYLAAAGQWAQDPLSAGPMIGASGAISAIIGAYALLFGQSRAPAIGPIPARLVQALWLAAAWIGLQLLIGLTGGLGFGNIAIAAHIGGFLAGLALARPLLMWRYRTA